MKNHGFSQHSVSDSGDDLQSDGRSTGSSPFSKLSVSGLMNSIVKKISRTATRTTDPNSRTSTTYTDNVVTRSPLPTEGRFRTTDVGTPRIPPSSTSTVHNTDSTESNQSDVRRPYRVNESETCSNVNSPRSSRFRDDVTSITEKRIPLDSDGFSDFRYSSKFSRMSSSSKVVAKKPGPILPQFRKQTSVSPSDSSESVISSPNKSTLPPYSSPYSGIFGQMPAVRLSPRPQPQPKRIEDLTKSVTVRISQPDPLRSPFLKHRAIVEIEKTRRASLPCNSAALETVAEVLRKRKRSGIDFEDNEAEAKLVEDDWQPLKRRRSRDDLNSADCTVEVSSAPVLAENPLSRGLKRRALHGDVDVEMGNISPDVVSTTKKVCQQSSPPMSSPPRRYACGAKNLIDASYSSSKRFEKRLQNESSFLSTPLASDHRESISSPIGRAISRRTSPCSSRLSGISHSASQAQIAEDQRSVVLPVPRSGLSSGRTSPSTANEKSLEPDLITPVRQPLLVKDGGNKNRVTVLGTGSSSETKLDFSQAEDTVKEFVSFTADDLENDRQLLFSRASRFLGEIDSPEEKKTSDVTSVPSTFTAPSSLPASSISSVNVVGQNVEGIQKPGLTATSSVAAAASVDVKEVGKGESTALSVTGVTTSASASQTLQAEIAGGASLASSGGFMFGAPTSKMSSASTASIGATVENQFGAAAKPLIAQSGGLTSTSDDKRDVEKKQTQPGKLPESGLSGSGVSAPATSTLEIGGAWSSTFGTSTTELKSSAAPVLGTASAAAVPTFGTPSTSFAFGGQDNAKKTEPQSSAVNLLSSSLNKPVATDLTKSSILAGSLQSNAVASKQDNSQTAVGGFAFGKSSSAPVPDVATPVTQSGAGGFAFGTSSTVSAAAGGFGLGSGSTTSSSSATVGGPLFGNPDSSKAMSGSFAFGGSGKTQTTSSSGFAFGSSGTTQTASGFALGGSGTTQTTASGGFGASNNTQTKSELALGVSGTGQPSGSGGFAFGKTAPAAPGGFAFGGSGAASTTSAGGSSSNSSGAQATSGGFAFGSSATQKPAASGAFAFGSSQVSQAAPGGFGFGSAGTAQTSVSGGFGSASSAQSNASGSVFGGAGSVQTTTGGGPVFGGVGSTKPPSTSFAVGTTGTTQAGFGGGFGNSSNVQTTSSGFAFGGSGAVQTASNGSFAFGKSGSSQTASSGAAFGGSGATQTSASGVFGNSAGTTQTTNGGFAFGNSNSSQTSSGAASGGFGNPGGAQIKPGGFAFGSSAGAAQQPSSGGFGFGNPGSTQTTSSGFAFGSGGPAQTTASSSFAFGAAQTTTSGSFGFGSSGNNQEAKGPNFAFGGTGNTQPTSSSGAVFGNPGFANSSVPQAGVPAQTNAGPFSFGQQTSTTGFGSSQATGSTAVQQSAFNFGGSSAANSSAGQPPSTIGSGGFAFGKSLNSPSPFNGPNAPVANQPTPFFGAKVEANASAGPASSFVFGKTENKTPSFAPNGGFGSNNSASNSSTQGFNFQGMATPSFQFGQTQHAGANGTPGGPVFAANPAAPVMFTPGAAPSSAIAGRTMVRARKKTGR